MDPPKTILVATDFSPAAEAALDTALGLAEKLGAKVHVLHAYQLPIVEFPDSFVVPTAEVNAGIITSARRELEDCLARSARRTGSHVPLAAVLEQADPREAVLNVAQSISADLVVMGTHGRSGISRALIGSVAEAVIRRASLPVVTVHAPPRV
jgi:nucleotide-binding universal stress UspA family protein